MRQAIGLLATLALLTAVPARGALVELADAVREYGPDAALAPVGKAFQMALIDTGWTVRAAAEHEITADTWFDDGFVKVRIQFGDGKATFTHLESENLTRDECTYFKGGKAFRGRCVEDGYYELLDQVIEALPLAHARAKFLQSLVDQGGAKP